MSKVALDSDLYGDIYGDDDNEFVVPFEEILNNETEQDETNQDSKDGSTHNSAHGSPNPSNKPSPDQPSKSITSDVHSSLPPKPISPHSANLSYSAQIAQQFSAYQQTPSQERQQRATIPLPQNPRPLAVTSTGTSAIATHEGPTNLGSDSIFGKKPSEMHDAGKLFIGGLNWDTTDEGLRDHFSQYGKVDACTIMRDPAGTSRGFAFLTFEDPTSVNAVVAREHILDGKSIDPKRAIPREEHLRNTRYFVGGLSPTSTSESMRAFFGAFGKVVDATVMVDRESGRSKGFGFVTFEDATNADQLVGKIGLVLDDKQIEVKMAQPRSQRDQAKSNISNHVIQSSPSHSGGEARIAQPILPFLPQQQQTLMPMLYQRSMNQAQMMGSGMPLMNMNPMAMMGMGMNGFNGMGAMNAMNGLNGMNGMNGMGGMSGGVSGMQGMGGMSGMNGMNGMNMMGGMSGMSNANMGPMRLGMGPMGNTGVNATGMVGNGGTGLMAGMAAGMRPVMNSNNTSSFNRMPMNGAGGLGPLRINNRGQHNFHPYAR